jgi:hypothetical protein
MKHSKKRREEKRREEKRRATDSISNLMFCILHKKDVMPLK